MRGLRMVFLLVGAIGVVTGGVLFSKVDNWQEHYDCE